MKTPILGASYVARSVNAADNRMVNLFPEIVPDGGKEPAFLQRAPGLKPFVTVGSGPIRGFWTHDIYLYVVSGGSFYRVDPYKNVTYIGDVLNEGGVSITDNGTQIFVASGGNGYIYNTVTFEFGRISNPNFPGAVNVGYLDGYFVFNAPLSQRVYVSALLDGTSINPLDFASAEGSPDNLTALIIDHREVWLFGYNSVEVWYDAGLPDFPLARIQGAFNEIGCIAPFSVAKMDNSIFWLGADSRGRGIVYRADGYTGKRISTHAVEWQIQQYSNLEDAVAYTYQQDGHSFYVLNFTDANATWVYDSSTQAWHERASLNNGVFTRHRGNCQSVYDGNIIIGDYQTNNVYTFDLTRYEDNGIPQKWLRSWRALPTGENNLTRTAQHSLQLDCETGVGLTGYDFSDSGIFNLLTESGDNLITQSGNRIIANVDLVQGANPQVMLRWSDDGGHTWSNEHWKTMGRVGAYGQRTIWRRLGMTLKIRDRVYEVSGTDPIKIAIIGAELKIDPTNA